MKIQKIYLISTDENKCFEIAKEIKNRDNSLGIAQKFTTNQEFADKSYPEKNIYYISEDQLNLDFRNNALLYVLTDSDNQESIGIDISEYENNVLIPISIKAFNTIKNNFLVDSLVVWIDVPMNKSNYSRIDYQINLIESKYFINNINKITNNFLYFTHKDNDSYIIDNIIDFYNGTDEIQEKILSDNN